MAVVYAFGNLSDDKKQVIGDTGWAVQIALDLDKSMYVFYLNEKKLFMYSVNTIAEEGNAYQKVISLPPFKTRQPWLLAVLLLVTNWIS